MRQKRIFSIIWVETQLQEFRSTPQKNPKFTHPTYHAHFQQAHFIYPKRKTKTLSIIRMGLNPKTKQWDHGGEKLTRLNYLYGQIWNEKFDKITSPAKWEIETDPRFLRRLSQEGYCYTSKVEFYCESEWER